MIHLLHTTNKRHLNTLFALCAFALSFGSLGACAQTKKTMFVSDRRVSCTANGFNNCMQIKYTKNGDWEPYYTTIDGFTYEEGYEYKLKVIKYNANSDKSTEPVMRYRLTKIVSKRETGYESPVAVAGTKWILREMIVDTQSLRFPDTLTYLIIDRKNGTLQGRGICNRFHTETYLSNGAIKTGAVAATKMYCQGQVVENALLDILQKATRYEITDDKLILFTETKSKLIFRNH